jgi:protein-tyrosine phosphatase
MTPTSILFVCLGNICRSPMAEGVFLSILERKGQSSDFIIDSAGTLGAHIGELADRRMRFFAEKRGYTLTHRSRKFTRADFGKFDWIIVMDDRNFDDIKSMAMTSEEVSKIHRMVDFCQKSDATYVPDPYYGGDQGFENVIDLLEDACEGLFSEVRGKK